MRATCTFGAAGICVFFKQTARSEARPPAVAFRCAVVRRPAIHDERSQKRWGRAALCVRHLRRRDLNRLPVIWRLGRIRFAHFRLHHFDRRGLGCRWTRNLTQPRLELLAVGARNAALYEQAIGQRKPADDGKGNEKNCAGPCYAQGSWPAGRGLLLIVIRILARRLLLRLRGRRSRPDLLRIRGASLRGAWCSSVGRDLLFQSIGIGVRALHGLGRFDHRRCKVLHRVRDSGRPRVRPRVGGQAWLRRGLHSRDLRIMVRFQSPQSPGNLTL